MYTYGTNRDRHVCAESLAPAHEEKNRHTSVSPISGVCADSVTRSAGHACAEKAFGVQIMGARTFLECRPPFPLFLLANASVCGGGRRVEEEFFSSSQKEKVGEKTAILSPSPKQELPALNPLPLLLAKVASQTKLTGNVYTIVHNNSMKDSLCTFVLHIHGKLHCLPAQRGKNKKKKCFGSTHLRENEREGV